YKIRKNFLEHYNLSEYDVVHAHSLFSNGYIAYLAYKKYKTPYITAVRNTDLDIFFKKMVHLRRLGVNILLNSQKIIFLSESYKNECIEKYIPQKFKSIIMEKAVVIPNGIDDYWFNNKLVVVPNQPFKKTINIIFVGNDSKRKNLNSL